MPTFGQAHFIRRAIQSVRAQTFTGWELIVVDDGSPDDTRRLIEPDLTDTRIRYVRLDSNRGLGAALNLALEQARGSLIAYAPSDDVYYADHLTTLVRCLERSA